MLDREPSRSFTTRTPNRRSIFLSDIQIDELDASIKETEGLLQQLNQKIKCDQDRAASLTEKADGIDELVESANKHLAAARANAIDMMLGGTKRKDKTMADLIEAFVVAATFKDESKSLRDQTIDIYASVMSDESTVSSHERRINEWRRRLAENQQAHEFRQELINANPARRDFLAKQLGMTTAALLTKFEVEVV